MGVKLLPKYQLAENQAKEKLRQIEEGLKVANRIDGLRKTYSQVEQELEAYRTSTLSAIGEDIRILTQRKEKLEADFKSLKEEYDRMLPEIPIKRAELATFEKSLKSWEKKLEKREEKAALEEIDVEEARQKTQNAALRSEDNERITRNLLIQANKEKIEADHLLQNVKKIEERAIEDKNTWIKELSLRESSIKTKEVDLIAKEVMLSAREKELNKEKVQVADMRETLSRSLERLKKNRIA